MHIALKCISLRPEMNTLGPLAPFDKNPTYHVQKNPNNHPIFFGPVFLT